MSLTNTLRAVAAPTAFALGVAFAANANALQPGQCLPAAEMMSQLKAEGQKSVIFANRIWGDEQKKIGGRYINVFTSNDQANLGYQIEGDAVYGENKAATKFCVVSDYTEIYLYNGKGNNLPSSIPQPSSLAAVVNNEDERRGLRPVMVMSRNGAVMVLAANPDIRNAYNGVMFVGNANPAKKAGELGGFAQVTFSSNVNVSKPSPADGPPVVTLK